ncbi:hypothetical protein [Anaerosphaera aminiphila]|nr:hypothetical protein [Anaerosphaera aminiphila]
MRKNKRTSTYFEIIQIFTFIGISIATFINFANLILVYLGKNKKGNV